MRGAAGIAKGVEQNPGLLLQRIGTLRVGQAGIGEREPQVPCGFIGLLQLLLGCGQHQLQAPAGCVVGGCVGMLERLVWRAASQAGGRQIEPDLGVLRCQQVGLLVSAVGCNGVATGHRLPCLLEHSLQHRLCLAAYQNSILVGLSRGR